ncbi:PH domain-containing protein [Alteribacillus iranensis]|uniref:Putative membrane protein n=1 Tax=Alteribacillus iranensis TaxID=930128 RepID=A0A1I1ZU43_9BACI|nr:PH domain-containing protein [Alteribacillus iranensis]SFE35122.1 putative membrane protein [Alteribacillus iranensis]
MTKLQNWPEWMKTTMSNWKKLHATSIPITFITRVKEFIIPLFLSFFAGGAGSSFSFSRWLFPAILLSLFIYSVVYWLSFRYRMEDDELRIKQGILVKKNRFIRKDRVQSVDITTGIVHRLFGVCKVKIETAGGGTEPEVELVSISLTEAESLKRRLGNGERTDDSKEEQEEEPFTSTFRYRVPGRLIVASGLTSGKVGLVFSAAAALLSQVDQFIPQQFYEKTVGTLVAFSTAALIIIFLTIAVVAWGISVIITFFQYGNFEISKTEQELTIERGILERRQLTLQLERITSVRYVTNPIRQLFGMWAIYVDSAGGGSKEENLSTILLPLGTKKDISYVMEHLLPEAQFPDHINKLPKVAARRYIFRTSILWWVLAVPFLFWVPNGWLYLLVPIFFTYFGWQRYKDSGCLFNDAHCILQTRHVNLSCNVLPKRRIQSLTNSQSLFQEPKKLYSLSAQILATSGGKTFLIKDIDERQRDDAVDWYIGNLRSSKNE